LGRTGELRHEEAYHFSRWFSSPDGHPPLGSPEGGRGDRAALEVELDEAVRGGRYERSPSRRGYRNGRIKRTLTTSEGPVSLEVPRARTVGANGETQEFQSTVLPRYARRTGEVNEAVLGAYFGGGNTRRIKRMLAPLLGEANLSKSAVSRLLAQVKELLASWSSRELSGEWYAVVYLDAIALKVRLARRVVTVPVLVALGASADGDRRVIAMRPATSESGASWEGFVSDLAARGLKAPRIVISDGHPGLKKAMEVWSKADVQRCAVHKLRNLLRACPRHAHAELKRDYDSIGYAEDGLSAREAYARMVTKWRIRRRCGSLCDQRTPLRT